MCFNYNLITLTVKSLGLYQENLTLENECLFILTFFGTKKNGCNEDLQASIYTHGIYKIY